MSLRPRSYCQVPEETVRVARAAFPGGSPAIRICDALGVIDEDEQFEDLFSSRGQPALSPGRLAMVLVLQFSEGLPDRQAAEAVRARIEQAEIIGADGIALLKAVNDAPAPAWLRLIPMVQRLRQVWVQQFHTVDDVVRRRHPKDLPPSSAAGLALRGSSA